MTSPSTRTRSEGEASLWVRTGRTFREQRIDRNLTVDNLRDMIASAIGERPSRSTITMVEGGKHPPSRKLLAAVSAVFGVSGRVLLANGIDPAALPRGNRWAPHGEHPSKARSGDVDRGPAHRASGTPTVDAPENPQGELF